MSLCRYGPLGGLLLAVMLVLTALLAPPALAQAETEREAATAVAGVSPDVWRQVRSGEVDANFRDTRFDSNYNLINASGERWRQLRNRWVSPFGLIAVGGMILAIALFYVIVGRKELSEPRTGRKLLRWPLFVRSLHWTVATLFIVLALTGLNLLYGKFVFRPLFGDAFWAWMISASKLAHNYLGPLFGILLVVLLARVLRHNWPKRHDLEWFRQGGGLVGKGHPDAGFANGGEKLWFWLLATAGLAVVASGFVLDFPNYGQSRDTMQWANLIHGVGALGLTAVALGHIYIGTLGSEGSLEAMTTGYVDETWAKDHHNLWYEEVKDQAVPEEAIGGDSRPGDERSETASRPG
ncbi:MULTISPECIES: formate dehydrogenase subunit gamma [Halomonas]|uniref:Formate dehydrogenase subunit gamma n=1 Tax=Halomonas mongoliensis TaxID=321265 RepID=A0ABU1GKI7_9GAMM|nr:MULTISPECIES: formate dehydrogenase subunit gamma [Halomonas]MDR5892537.1 formate dehydrogenase subunit gamma [Halomonas mongoliensis]